MTKSVQPNEMPPYRGRFAPSPSGPLHFGSLIAAVGSYLQAKSNQGKWLVRIEDIDPPREVPGASDLILKTLTSYGLHWDEPIIYQSQRSDAYEAALNQLDLDQRLYHCICTRKMIQSAGGIYQGSCREKERRDNRNSEDESALRFINSTPTLSFIDQLHGHCQMDKAFASEDFILKRRDGLYAYQLAVVVDDIEQGITEIVRGSDLLEPTVRQLALYAAMKASTPKYVHLPVAATKPNFKLSKQNGAPGLDLSNPIPTLYRAFQFLNLPVNPALLDASTEELLNWGVAHWHIQYLPKQREILFMT